MFTVQFPLCVRERFFPAGAPDGGGGNSRGGRVSTQSSEMMSLRPSLYQYCSLKNKNMERSKDEAALLQRIVKKGDLDELQRALSKNGYARICAAAAAIGHLGMLQWCSNHCPWDERTCAKAAKGGPFASAPVVQVLQMSLGQRHPQLR
ncbi:Ankyrin repeat domain containing protein [Balamuthia mandrillaris]